MRRMLFVLAAMLATAAIAVPAALGVSPHFINATGTLNADGSATVNFKEAGLGTNQNINYTLSADATEVVVCVNKGGGNPSASNKTTISGPVSSSGTFNSGKNGNVTASLTVGPLPSPSDFCPPGQKEEVASVAYTNILLTDTTNGISIGVPDISSGCLLPNVRGAC
jgi:hypothetical protein